ncbi:hypothetical protein B0H16DRAFT_1779247, partial [Mycena metata]
APTQCAGCGLSASSQCAGCMDAPEYERGNAIPTFYCGAKCQTSHWAIHKARCTNLKKRRRLLRVAAILRVALLTYREALFDIPLTKIELRDGVLFLHRQLFANASPRRFPQHLTTNMAHKEAALTHNQCTLALALLGPLARKLLADIASFIQHLDLAIGQPVLSTKLVEGGTDSSGAPHTVLKV